MRSQPSEGNEGICMQSKWKDVPKSDINIFNFGKYNFWIEIRRGMTSKNYRIKFILVSLYHFGCILDWYQSLCNTAAS